MPHHNLGSALEILNKPAEAEVAFREAARLRPSDGSIQYALASFLAGQNKYPEAERLYLIAMSLSPSDWLINSGYIDLLDRSGRLAPVEAEVKRRLNEQPNKPLLHRLLGDFAAHRQSFPESEAEYRSAIKLDEKDAIAHTRLSYVLEQQGKLKEAETAGRIGVELDPNSTWTQFHLGLFLNRQQKYAEAEIHLRKALELTPNLTYGYTSLITALRNQNKNIADVRRPSIPSSPLSGISAGPSGRPTARGTGNLKGQFELGTLDAGVASYSVARTRASQGSFPGGFSSLPPTSSRGGTTRPGFSNPAAEEAQLRDAITKNPKDGAVREKLCDLLIRQNSPRASSAIWDAICADPTNAKFHAYRGTAFGGSRNYAEVALRESIRLKADDPYPHRLLARALTNQGRHAEAVASAREAVRLEPGTRDNLSMLAWCLVRHGDLPGAAAAYSEALADPRSFNVNDRSDLSCVLRDMGKVQEADAEFEKIWRVARAQRAAMATTTLARHARLAANSPGPSISSMPRSAKTLRIALAAMRAGLIRLLQGDRQGYEKHCQQLLEQTAKDTSATNSRRTVHVCLVTPKIIGDLAAHVKLEEAFNVPATGYNLFLILRERALLAYRRGQWDDAIRLSRESRAEADKPAATPQPANQESSAAISDEQLGLYRAKPARRSDGPAPLGQIPRCSPGLHGGRPPQFPGVSVRSRIAGPGLGRLDHLRNPPPRGASSFGHRRQYRLARACGSRTRRGCCGRLENGRRRIQSRLRVAGRGFGLLDSGGHSRPASG